MKGLIFKEIYLSRKRIIISLCIYFFLMLMCMLVKMSAVHGNIRLLTDEAVNNTTTITFYLAIFGTVLTFPGLLADNISLDIVSHWSIFQRSTPMTEKQVVSAAYISNAVLLFSMTLIHTLMTLLVCLAFGEKFHAYYIVVFVIAAALCFLGESYRMLCFYRFRQQKKAQFVVTATFFCLYIAVCFTAFSRLLVYRDKANSHNAQLAEKMGLPSDAFDNVDIGRFIKEDLIAVKDFFTSYWWIFAVLLIALAFVLYFVSVNALKRPFDLAGQITKDKKEKKSFFSSLSKPKEAAEGDDN